MNGSVLQGQVDQLLNVLEKLESTIYDLGTPQLVEGDQVKQLVALGQPIVPHLLDRLKSASPKMAAYSVLVLGKLGDKRALVPLRELRTRYENKPDKQDWDYAVIGQSNIAIKSLEGA